MPMLTAITTIKSAIVRKAIGLVAPRVTNSPNEQQARPFSNSSQELPFLELKMLAATVQAPAPSGSMPNSAIVFLLCTNVSRIRDTSGLAIKKIMTENIASKTPHNASSHQLLIKV
jgi:hypothetical protein